MQTARRFGRPRSRGIAFILLAIALIGCQRGAEMAEPAYGTATCAACGTVIADQRYAAQYRLPNGTIKSFDDPACLFDALRTEAAAPAAIRFRAYDGTTWLTPDQAWFSRSPSTAGHGSGWAAYSSFAAAQDAVASGGSGEILSFDQAKTTLRRTP